MVQKNKRFVKLERTDIAPFRNDEYGISNDNKDMLLQMFTDNVTSSTENAVNANQVQPANQYSVNDLIQVETKILDTLESEQIDDGIKESTVEQGLGAIHSMIPQLVLDIYNLPIVTKSIDVFKQELSQITAPVTPEIHNLLGKYLKMIDTQMKIYSQVVDNTQVQQAQPVPVPTLPQPQARPATSQIQIEREQAIAQAQAQAQAIAQAQAQAQQPQQATAPIVKVNPANVVSQAPPPQAVPMPSATEGKKPRALDIVNFTNVILSSQGKDKDRIFDGINILANKQRYDLIPKFYELVKANEQNITFNVIEIANLVKGEISKRLASILATNQLSDPLRVEYNRMISRLDQLGESLKQEMEDDERYLEAQAQPLPALPAPAQAQPKQEQSPIKLTNNFSFEKFIERVMGLQGEDRIKTGLNVLISGKKPQYILEFAKYINEQARKGNFEYNDDEEASIMNDTYVDILTTALVNIQPSYHEDIQKVMTGFVKLRRKWEQEDAEQQAPTPAVPAPAQPKPEQVKQEDIKVKVEDAQQDDQAPAVPAPAVPAPLTNNNFEYHIVPLPPNLEYKYNNLIVCLVPQMSDVNKKTFEYYKNTLLKLPQYEKGVNKSELPKEIIQEARSEGFYKLNYKKALSSLGYANVLFIPKWQQLKSEDSMNNRLNMISKIFGTMPDFIGAGFKNQKATKKVTKKNNAKKNAPYYSEKDIIAYLLK